MEPTVHTMWRWAFSSGMVTHLAGPAPSKVPDGTILATPHHQPLIWHLLHLYNSASRQEEGQSTHKVAKHHRGPFARPLAGGEWLSKDAPTCDSTCSLTNCKLRTRHMQQDHVAVVLACWRGHVTSSLEVGGRPRRT